MNKILTIIIPTYNMEKYLRRCLDSLIIDEEGMKQLEVLVINDGSKDSSSQIAHEYQDKYPDTFRVIDKENGNYGSCINRGLKEATGKYVKVLDADDWFDNRNFTYFLLFLNKSDSDLVISNFVRVSEDGKELSHWRLRTKKEKIDMQDIDCFNYHMHSVTYKTSILKMIDYRQTEGISYTDTEWIFYPMKNVATINYFNHIIYKYLVGRDGQTIEETTVAKRIDQLIIILKKMLKEIYSLNFDIKLCTYDYMLNIIIRTLNYMYLVILISCRSEYNENKLVEFDLWLNDNYINIYERLEDSRYKSTSFKYINHWRINGRKKIQNDIIDKYEKQNKRIRIFLKLKTFFVNFIIIRTHH